MINKIYNIEEEGGEARIDIFGTIGEDFWGGKDNNTAIKWKDLIEDIKKKKKTCCHVRINSLGGDVNDALCMYDMLKGLDNVTTECIGFCASAGTIIFMAGKERHIASTARFLIHRCSSYAYGNANDLQRQMEMQRDVDDLITNIYTESGCDADKVRELMDANDGNGRWIGAEDAKEYGFATAISVGGTTNDSYCWRDLRNAQLPIPEDMRPSIAERIQDFINKIPKNMSKDNNNLESQISELQNRIAEQAATIEQQQQTIDTLTTERNNTMARVEELQRLIDQVPTEETSVNGNDNPPAEDPVANYMHNDPAYQQLRNELN